MMFKSHLVFGFLIGLLFIEYFPQSNQILFMLLVMIGTTLPDIDHPRSKLGKYLKPINFLFEHRGFFHSIFMLSIVYFLFYLIDVRFALPAAIGFFSHIISDAFTKQGVMPFHPLYKARIRGFVETGSAIEYLLFLILIIADVFLLMRL